MIRARRLWVSTLLLPLTLGLVRGQQQEQGMGSGSSAQTAAEDARVYAKVCSGCHAADTTKDSRRSRSQWDAVIEKMVTEGAVMTDSEYEAVIRYLLTRHGRVNVNTATADDLEMILRLSKDDAARIVARRTTVGRFDTFDQLAAVEGIDQAKLSASRSAIEF